MHSHATVGGVGAGMTGKRCLGTPRVLITRQETEEKKLPSYISDWIFDLITCGDENLKTRAVSPSR